MFLITKGPSQSMAVPNTCLVPAPPAPPVPTVFPSMAMANDANPGTCSLKTKFVNQPALVANSLFMRSMGDEAGVGGGVMSGMNMGPCTVKKGSTKVSVEGKPVATLTGMVAHNGMSANAPPGTIMSPSQPKVMVAP